jgi:hypothetical protein
MSTNLSGITSNAITWEKESSEIKEDSKGKSTISVMGSVGNDDDDISLEQAMLLIPMLIPITPNGPIGDSNLYTGARRVDRGAKYNGDGTIEVTATYEIALPENQVNPPESGSTTSDSDRVARTSATEDAPILTHPIVGTFDVTSRRNLASLLAGEIRVNPKFKSAEEGGADRELWEFIRDTEDGDIELVTFNPAEHLTLDAVTSSALEYARLIAAGVEVWKRPVVRHTITMARNEPVNDSEFTKVGEAMETDPKGAPPSPNGRQWFLNSISDSTDNGESWTINYEYELSGEGGVLKAIYPNGAAVIE